jgi:glucose-6-phosphate 1-dehydrogenase
VSANPLRDGMRMSRVPGPGALVIFGASGDLAHRKLLPALYNLALRNMLPSAFALVGVARSDYGGDEGFRKEVRKALEAHSRTQPIDDAVFDTFARGIYYVSGSFDDPKTYAELKRLLAQADRERGTQGNVVYYLATPPTVFPLITTQLGEAGMSRSRTANRSVVVEKPFGRDGASARELDGVIRSSFRERQVFRIDHYLGKETVQNILVLRFANGIFEPVWNRNFIDHVQITVAESLGVEGRGRFYEEAGAMRDIVQNHLLQVLSFVAMEPPGSFDVESVRNERGKVLATLR